ncbi:acyltransferase family protein [Hymenobacter latericus]|nr:acyltransferase family protein [Hymenobacter sp. YIM 151858-1]UYZ57461.1 acyltransferase family protein [Hymenobacter sp. YIM 151858-1]
MYFLVGLFVDSPLLDEPPLSFPTIANGLSGHLWFMGSMIFGYVVLNYLFNKLDDRLLLVAAIGIYAFVLANDAYTSLFHISPTKEASRFFVSISFLTIGYLLNKHNITDKVPLWLAVLVTVFGFVLQTTEIILLYKYTGASPHNQEFLFGTALFAVGLTLVATKLQLSTDNVFARIGRKYSLLIYLYHPLFILAIFSFVDIADWGGGWLYLVAPLLTFVVCLGTLILIEKLSPKVFKLLNGL